MRIYKLITMESHTGTAVTFHANKREADQEGLKFRKSYGDSVNSIEVIPIDFKPTKKGILSLLRSHAPVYNNG